MIRAQDLAAALVDVTMGTGVELVVLGEAEVRYRACAVGVDPVRNVLVLVTSEDHRVVEP